MYLCYTKSLKQDTTGLFSSSLLMHRIPLFPYIWGKWSDNELDYLSSSGTKTHPLTHTVKLMLLCFHFYWDNILSQQQLWPALMLNSFGSKSQWSQCPTWLLECGGQWSQTSQLSTNAVHWRHCCRCNDWPFTASGPDIGPLTDWLYFFFFPACK